MDSAEEMRHVAALVDRLVARFPQVPADAIAAAVSSAHGQLVDAPIRDFVPVLVEREVLDSLRARTRAREGGAA
jgi:hypothetical protein